MRTHTIHKQAPLMRMIQEPSKEPSHTPGPWYYTENAIIGNNGGTWISDNPAIKWEALGAATNNKHGLRENIKQANANAKLMASAPTMLEALQAVADRLDSASFPKVDLLTEAWIKDSLLVEQVRDAIRKATE